MKTQINRRILISMPLVAVIAVVAAVCSSSVVHSPVSRYRMTQLSDLHIPLDDPLYWKVKVSSEWANEPWTGDDAPYRLIERNADSALASSWSVGKLLEDASVAAQHNPTDPQAQFRWSYMARQVVLAQPTSNDWSEASEAIAVVLAHAVSPKTYSYDRLRFLVTNQNPDLTELGERLLQRDPNDALVKYCLSDDYSALFSEKSQQTHEVDQKLKQRALSLINQLIVASPSNPKYHGALAGVYASSFEDHKNPEDAAKAIVAYQDCFRLSPPDDNGRQRRQQIVALLQRYLSANPLPAN